MFKLEARFDHSPKAEELRVTVPAKSGRQSRDPMCVDMDCWSHGIVSVFVF